jgi:hypothetical protein
LVLLVGIVIALALVMCEAIPVDCITVPLSIRRLSSIVCHLHLRREKKG